MPVTTLKSSPNGCKLLSNGNIITPEGRWSFVYLFNATKPKNSPPERKAKFQCSILFKKDEDLKILQESVAAVMVEKHGEKDKWPKKWKTPFLKQGDYEYDGYEDGSYFIRCLSLKKPGLVNARNEYIESEDDVYSGCYGRLTVRPYWYDTDGSKGVSFGLQNAQKTRDGESIGGGGRSKAEDEFDAVDGDPMGAGGGATGSAKSADPLADMME